MSYQPMGILMDVDRCMRCRGCQVACERRSKMAPLNSSDFSTYGMGTMDEANPYGGGATKVSADDLVCVKSQKHVDMGPFVRYSCWHCLNPPCIPACPKGAIKQKDGTSKANGAIWVDYNLCQPGVTSCTLTGTSPNYSAKCTAACRKGGYPKIGDVANSEWTKNLTGSTMRMFKCDMCYDRIEAGKSPACVETCPAKALTFDNMVNLVARLNAADDGGVKFGYASGNDHIIWATRKTSFSAPKSDPFVEDHISPMMDRLLSGPFSKAFLVPTAVVGGLYAIYRRRETIAEEQAVREGV